MKYSKGVEKRYDATRQVEFLEVLIKSLKENPEMDLGSGIWRAESELGLFSIYEVATANDEIDHQIHEVLRYEVADIIGENNQIAEWGISNKELEKLDDSQIPNKVAITVAEGALYALEDYFEMLTREGDYDDDND